MREVFPSRHQGGRYRHRGWWFCHDPGTARERSELQVYIKVGAIALDELPPAYAARRGLRLDGTPIAPPAPPPVAPRVAEVFAEPIQEDPLEGVPKRKGNK
jgi:hypothetical protein